jgi:hypothetical protein
MATHHFQVGFHIDDLWKGDMDAHSAAAPTFFLIPI